MWLKHFPGQPLRRQILKHSSRRLITHGEASALGGGVGIYRENFSAAIGRSVGEELKEKGASLVVYLSFFLSLPSHNYEFWYHKWKVKERESSKWEFPQLQATRPTQPTLGHHWSAGDHLYFHVRSQFWVLAAFFCSHLDLLHTIYMYFF